MIVCNGCGQALSHVGQRCAQCSGKGIENSAGLRGLLSPSQQRGSPDRWAKSYTTTPSHTPQQRINSPLSGHFDISLDQSNSGLARVYGSVLDPTVKYPTCASCANDIPPGSKLYLCPRTTSIFVKGDVLCRSCFASHFSLGSCKLCGTAVLGEREEGGPHVKGRFGDLWHGKCFVCSVCLTPLSNGDHVLLPSGQPACLRCDADRCSTEDAGIGLPAPSRYPRPRKDQPHVRNAFEPADLYRHPVATTIAMQAKRQVVDDMRSLSRAAQAASHSGLCPGCGLAVASLDTNAIIGPQQFRWHRWCFVCGQNKGHGCRKLLDAEARSIDQTLYCLTCSLILGNQA